MNIRKDIDKDQLLRKASVASAFGSLLRPIISDFEKAKPAQIGEVRTRRDGTKWRKETGGWIPVTEGRKPKKQDDIKQDKKPAKDDNVGGKTTSPPDLTNHARGASDEALKRAAASSKDVNVARAAKDELARRGKSGETKPNSGSKDSKKEVITGAKKPDTGKDKSKSKQWYSDLHSKHDISPLPVGLDEKDVEVYDGSDTDSHWIMRWKNPKTGKVMNAYTKKFHEKNAKIKWSRTKALGGKKFLDNVSTKSKSMMSSDDSKKSQIGAVLFIISKTGLRVGDISNFKVTGNQGVTTLTKKSVKVDGNKVTLDFIGKSHKRNINTIEDKELADYMRSRIGASEGDNDMIFDISRDEVMNSFRNDMGYKRAKVKDIRTVVACEEAAKYLIVNDPPPPVPDNKKKAQKLIKEKLKKCFDHVSGILNNTPAMAQKSYVNPEIIDGWMSKVGADAIMKANVTDDYLSQITDNMGSGDDDLVGVPDQMIEDEQEDDEGFNYPDWWKETEREDGVVIESEHRGMVDKLKEYYNENGELPSDETIFGWIADDHLEEDPSYYMNLSNMEEGSDISGEQGIEKAGYTDAQQDKISKVMREFKAGTLKDSHGEKVTDKDQALAIALSEAGVSNKGSIN